MVLELYHRLKTRGLNTCYSIPSPLNQEDIVDTPGLTTIHVNRILRAFRDEGLLEIQRHELTILDYGVLCNLVRSEFEILVSNGYTHP